jgi:hypothetical protein
MTEKMCRDLSCARYEMSQFEFRQLRGELWDQSFVARLGKVASKLYREIYRKKPRAEVFRDGKSEPCPRVSVRHP